MLNDTVLYTYTT